MHTKQPMWLALMTLGCLSSAVLCAGFAVWRSRAASLLCERSIQPTQPLIIIHAKLSGQPAATLEAKNFFILKQHQSLTYFPYDQLSYNNNKT